MSQASCCARFNSSLPRQGTDPGASLQPGCVAQEGEQGGEQDGQCPASQRLLSSQTPTRWLAQNWPFSSLLPCWMADPGVQPRYRPEQELGEVTDGCRQTRRAADPQGPTPGPRQEMLRERLRARGAGLLEPCTHGHPEPHSTRQACPRPPGLGSSSCAQRDPRPHRAPLPAGPLACVNGF